MNTVFLLATVLAASCARDSRPTTSPQPAAEVPDLGLSVQRVDDLPITELVDPGATNKQPVSRAIAVLHPTANNTATGEVRFVEVAGQGIEVFARVHGLSDRPHAFHVHVYGDCSAPDATSAGPHFHFTGSSLDANAGVITGNLGELRKHANDEVSSHQARIPHASLQGEFSIIGRAVVVHAQRNDPAVTPDGAAGERVACAVIGVADPRSPTVATKR